MKKVTRRISPHTLITVGIFILCGIISQLNVPVPILIAMWVLLLVLFVLYKADFGSKSRSEQEEEMIQVIRDFTTGNFEPTGEELMWDDKTAMEYRKAENRFAPAEKDIDWGCLVMLPDRLYFESIDGKQLDLDYSTIASVSLDKFTYFTVTCISGEVWKFKTQDRKAWCLALQDQLAKTSAPIVSG